MNNFWRRSIVDLMGDFKNARMRGTTLKHSSNESRGPQFKENRGSKGDVPKG
jgi:hypothetical protein